MLVEPPLEHWKGLTRVELTDRTVRLRYRLHHKYELIVMRQWPKQVNCWLNIRLKQLLWQSAPSPDCTKVIAASSRINALRSLSVVYNILFVVYNNDIS